MPPFRGLSDEQVWQLVAYVRSLASAAAVDAGSTTSLPPPVGILLPARRSFSARPRARPVTTSERSRRCRRPRSLDGRPNCRSRRCARKFSIRTRRRAGRGRRGGGRGGGGGGGGGGAPGHGRRQDAATAARSAACGATKTRSRCRWWTPRASSICSTRRSWQQCPSRTDHSCRATTRSD